MKKNLYRYHHSILFLCILSILLSLVSLSLGDDMTCYHCNKSITGKFIRVDGHVFHPTCFKCARCGKPITGSYNNNGKNYYHPTCYQLSMGLVCAHCGKPLGDTWQEYKGKKYHKDCYEKHYRMRCGICNLPIYGTYTKDEFGVYHSDCYKQKKLPKCALCNEPIIGKYTEDPWGNKVHASHHANFCDSCGRVISTQTSNGGGRYGDDRLICGICLQTAVDDEQIAQQLVQKILKQFRKKFITGIPSHTPIFLVDRNQLKAVAQSYLSDNAKGFVKMKMTLVNHVKKSLEYEIYILHGLPKLEFMGTLAHELLHIWQYEHDVKLSERETEGFCNLGAALIYQIDTSRFADILIKNLEDDPDPIYGDGYRLMNEQLKSIGWKRLIKKLSN